MTELDRQTPGLDAAIRASEAERHGRVIASLEDHLRQLENATESEGVLDTPPMAG